VDTACAWLGVANTPDPLPPRMVDFHNPTVALSDACLCAARDSRSRKLITVTSVFLIDRGAYKAMSCHGRSLPVSLPGGPHSPWVVPTIQSSLFVAGNSSLVWTTSGVSFEAVVLTAGQYGYELILGFASEHGADPCLPVSVTL
jgi:hypothetical protein